MTETKSDDCAERAPQQNDWVCRASESLRQSLEIRFSDFLTPEGHRFRALCFGGQLWIACKDIKDEAKRRGGVISVTSENIKELHRRNNALIDGQSADKCFVLGKDIAEHFPELTRDLKQIMASAGYMTEYASRGAVSLFFHFARSVDPKQASTNLCVMCMQRLSDDSTIIARREGVPAGIEQDSEGDLSRYVSQLQKKNSVLERRILRLEQVSRSLVRVITSITQSNVASGRLMQADASRTEYLLKHVLNSEELSR